MNCQKAKELIDLRVHELVLDTEGRAGGGAIHPKDREGEDSSNRHVSDWSEVDAHLDACPQCRAEFEELRRVRRLLAAPTNDRPNDTEVQTMWTALQAAVAIPATTSVTNPKGWWVRNRSLVASMTGIAAVLMFAFQLGNLHYGSSMFSVAGIPFTNVEASLPTGSEATDSTAMTRGRGDLSMSQFGIETVERKARAAPPKASGRPERAPDALDSLDYAGSPAKSEPAPPAPPLGALADVGTIAMMKASGAHVTSGGQSVFGGASGAQVAPSAQVEKKGTAGSAGSSPDFGRGAPLVDLAAARAGPTQSPVPQNLKIIKTGELTVQVPIYSESIARVERTVQEKGGFVADGSTREEAGGALVGRMVIRVPPERFEETFTALKAVGRVESENVKAADVTAEYVDVEARIHSLQITEERLRDLIANKSFVDKIASLLEVEKELNRVRTEIEQFQGQLRVMADRVGLSTIVLTLREPGRTVPSASLSVEVSTLDEASQRLGDMLAKTDGRLVSGKTSKRSDGTLMGTYQLETTLARFAEVVSGVEALGRVEERQVKDQQFNEAGEPWAKQVTCTVALVLFERSRQLPTATVRLEVDKLEEAMKRLGDILQAHDAALASNQATRLSDGSNAAEIRVRVPAGRFAGLFDALSPLGRMTSKAVSGEAGRIVGGAAAVPCDVALTMAEKPREVPRGTMSVEVEAFDTARQALSRAIAERQVQVLSSSSSQRNDGTWQGTFRLGVPVKDMEAFVGKLETFGRVVARQISGLGLGDLSRTDPDALGVIDLTIGEKSTIAPAPDESAASIRARIRDGLGGFYTSIGLIAYGLVVLLPWLLLAGLVGWLVARTRRTLRNRRNVGTQTA